MLLFLVFFILLAGGFPIAISLGIVPLGYVLSTNEFVTAVVAYKMFDGLDKYTLTAIPLFILGGNLVTSVGLTDRLITFSNELIGRVRGGLSHVNVIVSTMFGGLNGSAVGDAAAVGSILIEPMKRSGFSKGYASAVTACSGTISGIVPPSVPFIIYASVVPGISIGALFIGGILPGIMICFGQCVVGYILSVRRDYPRIKTTFKWRRFINTTFSASPALILVVIIIGGLRSGVFNPTEIGSVICVYAITFGFFVNRELSIRSLCDCLYKTTVDLGIIILVVACAAPFMWLLIKTGTIETISSFFGGFTDNMMLWWLIVGIFLLISGCVMDPVANLLIVGPVIHVAATQIGLDPFTSSLVIVIILIMGVATPPVGISLFVTSAISGASIEDTSREVIPFLIPIVITVIILIVFPDVAKLLPRLFGYDV